MKRTIQVFFLSDYSKILEKKEAIRCKVKFSTFFFLKLNVLLTFSNGVFISRTPMMLVVKCFSSRFAKHIQKTGLPLFFVSIFSKFFYLIKWTHFYHTVIYIYTLSGNRAVNALRLFWFFCNGRYSFPELGFQVGFQIRI